MMYVCVCACVLGNKRRRRRQHKPTQQPGGKQLQGENRWDATG